MAANSVQTPESMKIGELERVSGVGRSTLHLYLSLGLLPPPEKRGPKLHLYGAGHLARLAEIKRLRARGLSLAEIKQRLARRARPHMLAPSTAPATTSSGGARGHGPARERVLAEAARLFTERGYERVHISEVARAAGVGKATLYQYFRSKSELFMACLDRLTAALTDAQRRYVEGEGQTLRNDVERYAAAMIASYPSYRMMISALGEAAFSEHRELSEKARTAFLHMATSFEPMLLRAMQSGRCRAMDSEMLAYMTWGALMAVGARLSHGDGRYSLHDGMRLYLDFVTHGLLPVSKTRRR